MRESTAITTAGERRRLSFPNISPRPIAHGLCAVCHTMLDQMANNYEVDPVYVLDMYRHSKDDPLRHFMAHIIRFKFNVVTEKIP